MSEQPTQRKLFWPIVIAVMAELPPVALSVALAFGALAILTLLGVTKLDSNIVLVTVFGLSFLVSVGATYSVLYQAVLHNRKPRHAVLSFLILLIVPLVLLAGVAVFIVRPGQDAHAARRPAAEAVQFQIAPDGAAHARTAAVGSRRFSLDKLRALTRQAAEADEQE